VTKTHLLIDIDGVLNPFSTRRDLLLRGFRCYHMLGFEVYFNPRHGAWLSDLQDVCILVWGTMWESQADQYVAEKVGLPRGLPYVKFGDVYASGWDGKPTTVSTFKLPGVQRYAETLPTGTPLVWIDDHLCKDAFKWARDRSKAGSPTLFLQTDEAVGLEGVHVDRVRTFAEKALKSTDNSVRTS